MGNDISKNKKKKGEDHVDYNHDKSSPRDFGNQGIVDINDHGMSNMNNIEQHNANPHLNQMSNQGQGQNINQIHINPNQQQYYPNQQQSIPNQSPYNNNMNQYDQMNQQQQQMQVNPAMPLLDKAFQLYTLANNQLKQFSFQEASINYEEALKLTTTAYYKINSDEQLKSRVDQFLKSINSQIEFTKFQIKNQFSYKKQAGFATKEEPKKIDYLESIRKSENFTCNNENVRFVESGTNEMKKQQIQNFQNTQNNQNNNESKISPEKTNNNKVVGNDLKERILTEIVDIGPGIKFSEVIGLDQAKQILKEIIVLPNIRPDLFTGLRAPPRGLLLFGPPGVGKTMIAKAVATECACTFFSISASSLTSKYLGESEKLVRALFDLAFEKQPSVVFIDEIESILSKRTDSENDATKRLKTEFLVQFDGVGSHTEAKVLIIGATNMPQELDSAVLRRLPKRVYIGPFNSDERKVFIQEIMRNNENVITDEEFNFIARMTENYSNSDLKELCREAAYEPIREISDMNLAKVTKLRPSSYEDFVKACKKVRGTLNKKMLEVLEEWNQSYGAIS
jgi:SpoVK/Ycf46/Vps4 family AAA+-type ATPase